MVLPYYPDPGRRRQAENPCAPTRPAGIIAGTWGVLRGRGTNHAKRHRCGRGGPGNLGRLGPGRRPGGQGGPDRKASAEAAWAAVGAGDFATLETNHLLIYAPKAWDKRLKDLGTLLEKQYDQARSALGYDDKTEPFSGKAVVYLFDERDHFAAFVRRVEKRRLESDDTACFSADDEALHAAVGPTQAKDDWGTDARAAEQLAALMLARKAGTKVPLPAWLTDGFGRATFYHAVGGPKTAADRQTAHQWAAKGSAKDIWSGATDLPALQGSLADYFAYGPQSSKFLALVKGFEPEENVEKQTTEHALDAAGFSADNVQKSWKGWATAR